MFWVTKLGWSDDDGDNDDDDDDVYSVNMSMLQQHAYCMTMLTITHIQQSSLILSGWGVSAQHEGPLHVQQGLGQQASAAALLQLLKTLHIGV